MNNKVYRVIWNSTLHVFQVCSELVRHVWCVGRVSSAPVPRISGKLSSVSLQSLLTCQVRRAIRPAGGLFAGLICVGGVSAENLSITDSQPFLTGSSASYSTIRIGDGLLSPSGFGVWGVGVNGSLHASNINVADGADGKFTVQEGGQISTDALVIGFSGVSGMAPGQGSMTVSGTGSSIDTLVTVVGAGGEDISSTDVSTLNIINGATIHSSTVLVGNKDAQGSLSIDGAGSLLMITGDDSFPLPSQLALSSSSGGRADIVISNGGLLAVGGTDGIQAYSPNYAFMLDGGEILAVGSALTSSIDMTFARNAVFNTGGLGMTLSGELTGDGGLIKKGEGTLLLTGNNSYQGPSTVERGTLRTDADNALGSTAALNIRNSAVVDLNGTVQTVGTLSSDDASFLSLHGGQLTTLNGGQLRGLLSGEGLLSVEGGTLALLGDNTELTAAIRIAPGAGVTIQSAHGAGSGYIENNGVLTVNTASDWTLGNAVSGGGNLTKSGAGVLTLSQSSAAYTGSTDITGGELVLGRDVASAVALPSREVNIGSGATLSGYGSTAGDVNVMRSGLLQVDFTVGGNLNNTGIVSLSREGHSAGGELTVNGNYTGNNGLLALRTVLGDDRSVTDKLTVKGDTRGTTRVTVTNAGGSGARTLNGIEVIKVEGMSGGEFMQEGRIVAGAYDYTLVRGKGGNNKNWYLNSTTSTGEELVVRPENMSYASNLRAANTLFSTSLHDREGEAKYTERLTRETETTSMWMRISGGHNRVSLSDGQNKAQANRYVVQLGGDVATWSTNGTNGYHLGVMGGYGNEHSRTENHHSGYDSRGEVHGYSAGLYGTWYQNDTDKSGTYVDSWMLYNWFNNSVKGEGLSTESYKSKGITASVETGYALKAGDWTTRSGMSNSVWLQPQAQIIWMGVHADDHTEQNGTHVATDGEDNLQTRLGMRASIQGHSARDDGKQREFEPFVEVNWLYNSKTYGVSMDGNNSHHIEGTRNIAELKTGVEAKMNDRLHLWGNIGQQMGGSGYSDTRGTLGVKYLF